MQNNLILYTTQDKKIKVELYEFGESVYLTQDLNAKLFLKKLCFDTLKQNITMHIKNILKDGELQEISVVKEYLTTASDKKQYNVNSILKDEKNLEETYKVLKER
ncbi:hypothetical protein [uncultured Helicobacter sp.]|uniref:hypothetical protein n=1 Tax=uncultured Helicobacter sp. TaxID=175537 RepID=UPI0037501B2E